MLGVNLQVLKRPRLAFLVAAIVFLVTATPVVAAALVQNAVANDFQVENSPIAILPGADDSSSFVDVSTGTFSNQDSGDGVGTDTMLASNTVSFTCFAGEKTVYSDVIQVANQTSEDWQVGYSIDNTAYNSSFGVDSNGDADVYLYTSNNDSTTPITTNPVTTPADWNNDLLQAEVVANNIQSTGDAATDAIAPVTIGAGEQRQVSIVVDCGTNLADEAGQGSQAEFTFNVTAEKV